MRDLIESKDLSAVSRGLDMSWKLKGAYAPERVQIQVDHVQLRVDLDKAIEALRAEGRDIPKLNDPNFIDAEA